MVELRIRRIFGSICQYTLRLNDDDDPLVIGSDWNLKETRSADVQKILLMHTKSSLSSSLPQLCRQQRNGM